RQILEEWNETEREIPEATLPKLFEEQALRTPEAVAVVYEEQELTYKELNERANRLAHYLRKLGVGRQAAREDVVGVCLERGIGTGWEAGIGMVTALLGILKAGGAYLPLDPQYPPSRLLYMVRDSVARIVIGEPTLGGRLGDGQVEVIDLERAEWEARDATDN